MNVNNLYHTMNKDNDLKLKNNSAKFIQKTKVWMTCPHGHM